MDQKDRLEFDGEPLTVRMSQQLRNDIEAAARDLEISASAWIRMLAKRALTKMKGEPNDKE